MNKLCGNCYKNVISLFADLIYTFVVVLPLLWFICYLTYCLHSWCMGINVEVYVQFFLNYIQFLIDPSEKLLS